MVAELSVIPVGTARTGLSELIAKAVEEIKRAGVKYQLHPAGTVYEAPDLGTALKVAEAAHRAVLEAGVKRVITILHLDERLDEPRTLEERVKRVEARLG